VVYRRLLDEKRSLIMISPLIAKFTGYPHETFLSNDKDQFMEIIHPDDISYIMDAARKQIQSNSEFEIEYRIIHKSGKIIWFNDKGSVRYKSESGTVFIDGVIEDITKRKNDQEELEKYKHHLEELVTKRTIKLQALNKDLQDAMSDLRTTQAQLIQSEKMASLGILTAGVAPEINNPLNYILGGVSGLEKYFEEIPGTEETEMMLSTIKNGVSRASNIVKGLNQFSRTNRVNTEHCDIHSIILNCINMLDYELKQRAEIETIFTDAPYLIVGNVGKLHQVFINVLNNAYQAIEDFGKITIVTSVYEDHMLIAISDNGKGINEADLKKITDPFFTTKEPGQGTGLGLSISYNIIKEHGGVINYQSQESVGTTANIRLPLTYLIDYNVTDEPESI
jgi:PAS domain S-box-containing protein